MMSSVSMSLPEFRLYKKALEILELSRSISWYIRPDLARLKSNGEEDGDIYFSGDIVQQSTTLLSEIKEASLMNQSIGKKHKYILSTNRLMQHLYKNCKRLEHCNSNGRDYIKLLRNELKKFKILHRKWSLSM